MSEIWKDIVGYEEYYEVSSHGRVRNKKTMRVFEPSINSDGYFQVILSYKKVKKSFKVHRLVGVAFIDNLKNKSDIDHIDRNKQNNNINNLKWATRNENMINTDRVDNAKHIRISKNNKYQVRIARFKKTFCDTFDTETEAIEWRDKKLIELAALNNDE
jgi:hypothetical protein